MIIKHEEDFYLNEQESQELEETGYVVTDDGYCFAEHDDFIMVFKELSGSYSVHYSRNTNNKTFKVLKAEKENEVLKRIIKKLFEQGTPLCQYTSRDGKLMIEASDAMPLFNLGTCKGIDLDKKLEEVLNNEQDNS